VEHILANTQGNLTQWQSMYQEIQTRFADMQVQFESSRVAASQLNELLAQKDAQMAAESARYNDIIRQRESELGYATSLLRAKEEEITALRSETLQLRMTPPTIIERTLVAPPPMTEVITMPTEMMGTVYSETYTPPIISEASYAMPAQTSYITESYVTPAVFAEQPMIIDSGSFLPPVTTTTTYTTIGEPMYAQQWDMGTIPQSGQSLLPLDQQHRAGRLKVLVTEGTDFGRKHKRPYVLLTVGSHTTHTHATKRDKQRHVSWNEMAEFDVQDASSEILRVSIAEKHRIRHDEKFAASRPIPLAQLPYNTPRSFTADTGLGRVNLQLELLPPTSSNSSSNPFNRLSDPSSGLPHNHHYTTL